MFGEGISREGDILDLAVNRDIIKKSGAWFSYNEQKIGQGRENVKKYLKENPEIADEIVEKIKVTKEVTKSKKPSKKDKAEEESEE